MLYVLSLRVSVRFKTQQGWCWRKGWGKGSLVVNMFCIRLLHIFLFLQKCVSLVTFALLCVAMQNTLMQGLDGGMG